MLSVDFKPFVIAFADGLLFRFETDSISVLVIEIQKFGVRIAGINLRSGENIQTNKF